MENIGIFVFIIGIACHSSLGKDDLKCPVTISGQQMNKSIGEIWNSTIDPCVKFVCETNEDNGTTTVIQRTLREYCYLMCNNEFELQTKSGQCCGECIQSKCKFNGNIYEVGNMWKSLDTCTFYQCVQHEFGVKIVSYKKTCPKLGPCSSGKIYTKDCCRYCEYEDMSKKQVSKKNHFNFVFNVEYYDNIMNKSIYDNHPCKRECQDNSSMVCEYTFLLEGYETLSKACYDCPYNQNDCYRPHCIFADGIRRSLTVVNRMMPGPSINVCFGDTIVVDVINHLMGESTTIHWHGMHQRDNPYMDGVPHITQCPIPPHSTFRYTFKADNEGTHWWHSHVGTQRSDGAFGALIIRQPKSNIPNSNLYNFDLSEHMLLIQDWIHGTSVSNFNAFHHSIGDNKPENILINGKGKFMNNKNAREIQTILTTEGNDETTIQTQEAATIVPLTQNDVNAEEHVQNYFTNRDNPTTMLPPTELPITDKQYTVMSLQHKQKRALNQPLVITPPLEVYEVTHGERYRFRIINAGFLNCPVEISIDDHNLTVIASDGWYFKPVSVSTFVVYAGERFDFVLNANQTIDNYWIRVRGLMDCDERFEKAHQVAILRYSGAEIKEPNGVAPIYDYHRSGMQLNALNRGTSHNDSISIAELTAIDDDNEKLLLPNADYKFYVYYDFYDRDNPHFNNPTFYGMNAVTNSKNQFFGPQLNRISMKIPSTPLLLNKDHHDMDAKFCNESSLAALNIDCKVEFCECTHLLQIPLNSSVELIIVDEGYKYDANHPFHLHGHSFRVVGMERLKPEGLSIEELQELEDAGQIQRRLHGAPKKDTITVPDGGYTIIRFYADNPGFWLFHCHIDYHIEVGMALVFKVGDAKQMVSVPKNFPTCSNYMPNLKDNSMSSRINGATILTMAILSVINLLQ